MTHVATQPARQFISRFRLAGRCARRDGQQENPPRRRGSVTLEFILVMPILFIAFLATFEFGILMIIELTVVTAVQEGAREAAKVGASTPTVASDVGQFLALHNITLSTTGTNTTDGARLVIEQGPAAGQVGNTTIPCSAHGPTSLAGNEVRATLCVTMTDAMDHPVPNWLRYFGLSLTGKTFEVSSLSLVE